MEDPYFSVQEEIETGLKEAERLGQNVRRLTANQNAALSAELSWTAAALAEAVARLSGDAEDVALAVAAAARDPARFNIDPAELERRREFVTRATRAIADLKRLSENATLSQKPHQRAQSEATARYSNSNSNKQQQQPSNLNNNNNNNNREKLLSSKNGTPVARPGGSASNDQFVEREGGLQQMIMREQDAQLDGVAATVTNMKEIAVVMNQELDDQTALLQDLDVQVDMTQGKLDMGMKRLKEFIDANADTKQQWTICCLIIALVVLVVIVFSM